MEFREHGNNTDLSIASYIFEVHPDGHFQLIIFTQSFGNIVLIPWTRSTAIHPGEASNLLEVMNQGPRLTFFVNDQQVTSIIDVSFLAGAADPVALEEGHAVVSTFKVWNLP